MREFKIYTAGKMSGLTFEDQIRWRNNIEKSIKAKTDKKITFIHPPMYYGYEINFHKTLREIKEWELNQIRSCDIIIVNLDDINDSIGTHIEFGFIDAVNSLGGKHIYVVGLGGDEATIYPWLQDTLLRTENNIEDLASYVVEYLLV